MSTRRTAGRTTLVLVLGMLGISTILATSPNCTAAEPCPIIRLELQPGWVTIQVGATQRFTVAAFDEEENEVPDPIVDWSTSDSTVATVDSEGLATGVKPGTAFITALLAESEGPSDQAGLVVVPRP
jgi:hypothetical protein